MYRLKSCNKNLIADNITPVETYLKLRDLFPGSLLLESSNFHAQGKNFSIICIDPIAEIIIDNDYIFSRYPDKCEEKISLTERTKNGCEILENFMKQFYSENKCLSFSGFYGYFSYDSFPFFEKISFRQNSHKNYQIPKVRFAFFRNLLSFNNLNNEITIYSHTFNKAEYFSIFKIISLLFNQKIISLPFRTIKRLSSNLTDNGYKELVGKSIRACKFGYVFQIVPSRQYQQKFKGDEFNIYRSMRSLNPSPHLFYFDYEDYKIFGSSPEYQFTIIDNTAYIFPIAGTLYRSSKDFKNKILIEELSKNTKENSEHSMLVDLARNDLSRNYAVVKVESYKDLKYFSHVLHLETRVIGNLPLHYSPGKVFVEPFPSGTLIGAPKYKAMELLDEFENQSRGIYGGSIGFFCLDGRINTAIIIRTFLSKGNTLFIQAGAGVVKDSTEEKELQEIDNKLKALNKSIIAAEKYFIK